MTLDKKIIKDSFGADDMNDTSTVLQLFQHLDQRITNLEKDIDLKIEKKFSELYKVLVFAIGIPIVLQFGILVLNHVWK